MLVEGGRTLVGASLVDADILIRSGRIVAVVSRADRGPGSLQNEIPDEEERLDVSGCIVSPGLIDLHFHGCMGSDLCDATPEALHAIASYEASRGVTAICPATMAYPEERLDAVMAQVAAFAPAAGESSLVGVNLEGSFISPVRVGAQNPAFVQRCDVSMMHRLQETAHGLIKIVAVAPEEPGALEFVREISGEVRASLAHTCADYVCAAEAFDAGARHLTHLFNAMPPLHHREPGPIGAAVERDDVTPELIADGVHVHPAMVRLAFDLFGASRMILVSDSMRACGMGDGVYDLGGQEVHVEGARATLADGTLAGSVTDLAACVRIATREMGIPLESVLLAATANPARVLGVDGERGSIEAGKLADLVCFDVDLRVKHVILRGELLRS